mgnify:CR=1 FL=1|tara:strand:+ start:2621 stop:2914 length:294 start_codon:yes stop_codon:yes gene_type:complete
MTLADYDKKIEELKVVRAKAKGLQKAELTVLIDDLETKRVSFLTQPINEADFGFSQGNIAELKEIAQKFETATEEIEEANELIDRAINLGKKLVLLL